MDDETELNLEQTIDKEKISEKERRKASIKDYERERLLLLKDVEDKENAIIGRKTNISQSWSEAIKVIDEIYNEGSKQLTSIANSITKMIGIDLYEQRYQKRIGKVKNLANSMNQQLLFLDNYLNNENGEQGLRVKLEKQKQTTTAIADTIRHTYNMIKNYNLEMENKKQELKESRTEATKNPNADYETDITYLNKEIFQMKKEKEGLEKDIEDMEYKIESYDQLIETNETIISVIEECYNLGRDAYRQLESEIRMVQAFSETQGAIKTGLITTLENIDEVVETTDNLKQQGGHVSKVLSTGLKELREKMSNLRRNNNNTNHYLTDIKTQSNNNKYEMKEKIKSLVNKYSTIPEE